MVACIRAEVEVLMRSSSEPSFSFAWTVIVCLYRRSTIFKLGAHSFDAIEEGQKMW